MEKEQAKIKDLLSQKNWHSERKKLRSILLKCGLAEVVKWGKLCYTFKGNNVAIIYGLKSYCALGFFKGSLLNDGKRVLVQPGKHSQAMRQIRFTSLDQISAMQVTVVEYIQEAISIEEAGLEVDFVAKHELSYPAELQQQLNDDKKLATAFENLTSGRKRGYVLHFSDAKQSETRTSRVLKFREKILEGRGLNDR